MYPKIPACKFTTIKDSYNYSSFSSVLNAMEVCITNNEVILICWRLDVRVYDVTSHYVNFVERRIYKQNTYSFAAHNSRIA